MKVLVIEDERRIRSLLARALETEGFAVDAAADGPDGLALALDGQHDVVILDLVLPHVDGLTVLRELKRERPELPVMIVSARSDIRTKLRGFELGASDYMAKPFAFGELVARIRVQLRVHSSEDGMRLTACGIVLDLTRRQARFEGRVSDLSDREFRLLRHLIENAGDVVTRESIVSAVWDREFDPRSNVVDVCMRRLRKKLGDEAPIETVRHAGYRLTTA